MRAYRNDGRKEATRNGNLHANARADARGQQEHHAQMHGLAQDNARAIGPASLKGATGYGKDMRERMRA